VHPVKKTVTQDIDAKNHILNIPGFIIPFRCKNLFIIVKIRPNTKIHPGVYIIFPAAKIGVLPYIFANY
jgi:hypothetical protein